MKKLAMIGMGLVLALTGCGSSERIRQTMTVEIETPAGLKVGSAVREAVNDDAAWNLGEVA